ncbi:RagB/SusD family nutrient uptake outer membrane protein [Puia sp. P3]|uniref:RagB/SusD family nutrient uptake outer membrane protein n=1 Tax=Puia sp. P3 TaxID=3423952 RepID=UPI003D67D1C7
MNKIFVWIMAAVAMTSVTSCKKYLNETVVAGVSYQLYETPAGIEGALVSAYNTLRQDVEGENLLTFSDAGTDLFTNGSDGSTTWNQYLATLSSLDPRAASFWDYHYSGIGQCNVTLDYLPKVTGMDDSRKKVIEAETRFLRGWYYFDLVQHYGKVPLVLASTSKVTTDYKRAAVKDVYASILSDLKKAFDQLPVTPAQQGRATRAAAAQLLAKVYLARGSASFGNAAGRPRHTGFRYRQRDLLCFADRRRATGEIFAGVRLRPAVGPEEPDQQRSHLRRAVLYQRHQQRRRQQYAPVPRTAVRRRQYKDPAALPRLWTTLSPRPSHTLRL